MDSKNKILQQQIYTPPKYQQLLSIILVHHSSSSDDLLTTLHNLLKQVYQPFEIIIIDNTNDANYNIVDNYIINNNLTHVQLYPSNTSDIYECLNIGLQYAKGNYIAFEFDSTSSPMRFIHQINELMTKRLLTPEMCLGLGSKNGDLHVSYKSMIFTRNVFNSIGYFLTEYGDMCFEEYMWRFVSVSQKTKPEHKTMDNLIKRINNIKLLDTFVMYDKNKQTNDSSESRQKYLMDQKQMSNINNFLIEYNDTEPQETTSYLTRVYDILKGDCPENRVTFVYYIKTLKDLTIEHVNHVFKCENISTLVYCSNDIQIDQINGKPDNAQFFNQDSFASAYHDAFSTNKITTPYAFIINGYDFDPKVLLHPLSYLLDMMDKYKGDINTLRFNSSINATNTIDKELHKTSVFPDAVYTTGFTDDPQIVNVRHTTMFKLPFINKNMRGDSGVCDMLQKKYANATIALKLKTCLYGGLQYPQVSKKI